MARRAKAERFEVTGPGLDFALSYPEVGQALSRSITAAERSPGEGTWYVRDAITGHTLGYTEVIITGNKRSERTTVTVLNTEGRKVRK